MRIASVSDIHLDFARNRELFAKMAAQIHACRADAVLVVGDVSHIDELIARCILALKQVVDVVGYLPGNHDLWVNRPGEDLRDDRSFNTWNRHDHVLRALVESAGGHYLPAKPLRLDDVAIAGSCGWYDYSFFRSDFRKEVTASA
ncbi:MAG: metallophosphoesterase, partial [Myxococcales bacterium]|nr:metallophosphoesterase [Myxococcales bacterium]